MDPGERKGWTEVITAEDFDYHMATIGQAETNSKIIREMFSEFPLPNNSKLLVAGCGTCQMFDYLEPKKIGTYQFIFSDINQSFFEVAKKRMKNFPEAEYKFVIDDIESTKINEKIDGVIAVLLLEHIDWKKGIDSFVKLKPNRIYLIIQVQDDKKSFVTKGMKLRPSIEEFSKIANPQPVKEQELSNYLKNKSYKLIKKIKRPVQDDKAMVGLVFEQI